MQIPKGAQLGLEYQKINLSNQSQPTEAMNWAEKRLSNFLKDGKDYILLDLGNIAYLNKMNLYWVGKWVKNFKNVGGELNLISPSKEIHRILERSGLENVCNCYNSVGEFQENVTNAEIINDIEPRFENQVLVSEEPFKKEIPKSPPAPVANQDWSASSSIQFVEDTQVLPESSVIPDGETLKKEESETDEIPDSIFAEDEDLEVVEELKDTMEASETIATEISRGSQEPDAEESTEGESEIDASQIKGVGEVAEITGDYACLGCGEEEPILKGFPFPACSNEQCEGPQDGWYPVCDIF